MGLWISVKKTAVLASHTHILVIGPLSGLNYTISLEYF